MVRLACPLALRGTVPKVVVPSVKVTVPVGVPAPGVALTVAVRVTGWPKLEELGLWVSTVVVGAWAMLRVCWTWSGAVKLALPAWLASMTQVPTPVKVTAPVADTVQAPEVEEASAEKTSGLPDAPPVALAV